MASSSRRRRGSPGPGAGRWKSDGRPEQIREAIEGSLRRLRVERIDLYQVHTPDRKVPYAETVGAFRDLQQAGKVRHVGVSNVNVEQLAEARGIVEVVSVQNRYNLTDRESEPVLEVCDRESLPFIPWFPLATGKLGGARSSAWPPGAVSRPCRSGSAWLLHRSKIMLPIPGTSKVAHLEENTAAAEADLTDEDLSELEGATARQDVGGTSTTRSSSRPKSQTSMNGGSTPSVVRAVQIWLR